MFVYRTLSPRCRPLIFSVVHNKTELVHSSAPAFQSIFQQAVLSEVNSRDLSISADCSSISYNSILQPHPYMRLQHADWIEKSCRQQDLRNSYMLLKSMLGRKDFSKWLRKSLNISISDSIDINKTSRF